MAWGTDGHHDTNNEVIQRAALLLDQMGKRSAGSAPRGRREIVFDMGKRNDYLNGFRKRKNERRQFARQKIEKEVHAEKLNERQLRREQQRAARLGPLADVEDDKDGNDDDGNDSDDNDGPVSASYLVDGESCLTTVAVSSLLADEPTGAERAPPRPTAGKQTAADEVRKKKKYDLNKSLSHAIPGYKAPAGLQKKRKKKKKPKIVSKKDKAKHRALSRQ